MKKTNVSRMSAVLIVSVVFCLLFTSNVASGEPLLIEADEPLSSPFRRLSEIQHILPRSPHRLGDVGSGADDWATITSQYNQPRSNSVGGTRMHRGVDLSSWVGGVPTNRTLFSTTDRARVWLIHTDVPTSGGFGIHVVLQNEHHENGRIFHFQTLYAHLSSIGNISLGQGVYTTTPLIGRTGRSGATDIVHLHMEKLTPTHMDLATGGGPRGTRRYPPSFFYWRAPRTWGSDTSFINRAAAIGTNAVSFRIRERGVSIAQADVGLFWRIGSTAWQGQFGNMHKSGDNFSFTFAGHPVGTVIQYYVQARSSTWDRVARIASRPYRYSDGRAPTTRPFEHTMLGLLALGSPDAIPASLAGETAPAASQRQWGIEYDPEINKVDPSQTEQYPISDKDKFLGAVVVEQVVDEFTFVAREIVGRAAAYSPILGRRIILRVSDIRGMGRLVVGEQYRVLGQITSEDPLTVTFPNGEEIRRLFSEH